MISCRNISFEDDLDWDEIIKSSKTATFFQTKEWLQIWTKHFRAESKILGVYEEDKLIGIAPFDSSGGNADFLGVKNIASGDSLSDYGDIITASGREKEVWKTVIDNSQSTTFNFQFIREDSPSFGILKSLGGKVEEIEVAPYIDLPKTWDEYLSTLDRHDRHEIRRKMRKLDEAGVEKINSQGKGEDADIFLDLMGKSEEKKGFLSETMKSFFREMIEALGRIGALELSFLKMDNKYLAGVILFYFKDEVLLYNSGFDPEYSYLSPGLILKVMTIKEAIEEQKKRYDFLRGGEKYKYDLGGRERKLYKVTF